MSKYVRIAVVVILSLSIILSCTVVGSKMTDPATYTHIIEMLDKNRTTVLTLSAASAAASAAISALPSDVCSPLAEQLSDFSTWFLLILCVVFLEKYLLTILGAAACYLLIPAGCSAILIFCFFPIDSLKRIGIKLIAFSAVLLLVVPTSVWVSDQINAIYSKSIDITVESANAVSKNLIETTSNSEDEASAIDTAKMILDNISGSVAGVVSQFKNVLNRFIEATAVMLVTNCLIPLLIILFFVWIIKTLFGIQIVLPQQLINPIRKRHRKDFSDKEEQLALNPQD